jgi:hypothetical protein
MRNFRLDPTIQLNIADDPRIQLPQRPSAPGPTSRPAIDAYGELNMSL